MELSLLHSLSFTAKQNQRNPVPAKITIVAPFVVFSPAGIVLRNSDRLLTDRATALWIGAAGIAA